jgi:hypothetical protein
VTRKGVLEWGKRSAVVEQRIRGGREWAVSEETEWEEIL